MVLDVVYNHLGASGVKAVEAFGPYFTEQYETPVGQGRSTSTTPTATPCASGLLQSAEGWVRDLHVDGLRLDAIHAIYDESARPRAARAGRPRARGATTARSSSPSPA